MGRKRAFPWRWRIAAALLLALLIAGIWSWWEVQHWAPPRDEFPVQGVIVGARDGAVDFRALAAIGGQFAYLEGSDGGARRDSAFAGNLSAARRAGLPVGVIHAYDPCVTAERQAANFLVTVPRSADLLPPAIALDRLADRCEDGLSEAALESELTTFINQIEGHVGSRVLLKIAPEFQDRYRIANHIERDLWLERDWMPPTYAGRPWTLWTANGALRTEASADPLRWVVAQP